MLLNPVFQNFMLSGWLIDARCEKLCCKSLLTLELCNTYTGLLFPTFTHNFLFLVCQNRPAETNSEVDKSASPSVAQLAGKFKEQAANIPGKEVRCRKRGKQEIEWEVNHLSFPAGTSVSMNPP